MGPRLKAIQGRQCPRVKNVASAKVQILQAGLACCGVEAAAVDLVAQLEHSEIDVFDVADATTTQPANILVVAGTVTKALAPKVLAAYESLATPKVVVAYGVCAITGGPYWDSYSVLQGAAELIPVNINVPGCPPSPTDLAAAISQAQKLVAQNA